MTTTPIQRTFRRYEQAGWPGQLARPYAPYAYDSGVIGVPTGGVSPMPSYPVVWHAATNRFRLPTTDAENVSVCGILSYESGTVGSTVSPTIENSPLGIVYSDGNIVKVGVLGTFYGIAAEAMEYGDLVEWEWRTSNPTVTDGEQKWKKRAVPTVGAASPTLPAAGDTLGLPNTGDFSAVAAQTAAKAAIDGIISDLRDQVIAAISDFYRIPIACASPAPVAAGDLVELRIGYQIR